MRAVGGQRQKVAQGAGTAYLKGEMAEDERAYPKAPITEAVLDIRVGPPQGLDADALSPVVDRMRAVYQETEDQFELQAAQPSNQGAQQSPPVQRKKIGFRA